MKRKPLPMAPLVSRSAGRLSCGTCSVCCVDLSIDVLNKPIGVPCVHLTETGCGSYGVRPKVCRDFACDYILGKVSLAPDRCGLLFIRTSPYWANANRIHRYPVDLGVVREVVEESLLLVVSMGKGKKVLLVWKDSATRIKLLLTGRVRVAYDKFSASGRLDEVLLDEVSEAGIGIFDGG